MESAVPTQPRWAIGPGWVTSSPARPIIDVTPVLAFTNEMGAFQAALDSLCGAYDGLFHLVTYDAGACSAHNATLVRELPFLVLEYLIGADLEGLGVPVGACRGGSGEGARSLGDGV
jgi:hypothetical protein